MFISIPRPREKEALYVTVIREQGDQQWLDMTERLRRIRDHALSIMVSRWCNGFEKKNYLKLCLNILM